MALFRIRGGEVYDPINGVDGQIRDLWIDGAIFVDPTAAALNQGGGTPRPTKEIDARGFVVMPGGVDMHSHIAGPKVNAARKLRPEWPVTVGSSSHSTTDVGRLYSSLGYTSVFDAAVPALFARHAHYELNDTPNLDAGFLVLVGNHHFVLDAVQANDQDRVDGFLAWLLTSARGFGVKLVNPGGIEAWKEKSRRSLVDFDETVGAFRTTPRSIVRALASAADRLHLPHPIHIHANNLGAPGNFQTTLATLEALEGSRGHFAHLQFHSYAGDPADDGSIRSAVPQMVEAFAKQPNISFDVGHVTFGPTTALTGDGPLGRRLHRVAGEKWFSCDSEMESGCGVVPIEYKHRSLVHSVQWAIGLEWYLLGQDPWRMALSTDHPNGGLFVRYPETIRLLMNRDYRKEQFKKTHPRTAERTVLADLDREYSLYEIAILTRAAPARLLGLAHKGHLGVGADADLVLYDPRGRPAEMFARPRLVMKGGVVVYDDGEHRGDSAGTTLWAKTPNPDRLTPEIRKWFSANYSVEFENYGFAELEIQSRKIPFPRYRSSSQRALMSTQQTYQPIHFRLAAISPRVCQPSSFAERSEINHPTV